MLTDVSLYLLKPMPMPAVVLRPKTRVFRSRCIAAVGGKTIRKAAPVTLPLPVDSGLAARGDEEFRH